MRGLARTFGVKCNAATKWLKKASHLPPLPLVHPQPDDVLELDELWSLVQVRKNKRWVWLTQCRRTRQIVAYAIGNRDEVACRLLWQRVPQEYRQGLCYTDFWLSYANVLPKKQHRPGGKGRVNLSHRAL